MNDEIAKIDADWKELQQLKGAIAVSHRADLYCTAFLVQFSKDCNY